VSPITVAPYAPSDRAEVVAFWQDVFANYRDTPSGQLDCALRHRDNAIFVAREDGVLAGTAMAGSDGIRGWLHYVAVPAPRRRGGVARLLVRRAEDWLAARGVTKVNLQIRGDNLDVRAFYERLGYAAEDRLSMGRRLDDNAITKPATGAPGTLDVTITHLEMTAPPRAPSPPPPPQKIAVLRAEAIAIPFYRFLYDAVGREWIWYERRRLDDAALAAIVHHAANDIFVLYVGGQPAGYVEFDRRALPDAIDMSYFGLAPAFIGRGLGRWFLSWSIAEAWRHSPRRLVVNTCTLDHPKALGLYQRAGFVPTRQETKTIRDPRPLA
jgi:GNAT superfamily N-acetyltransferase